MWRTESSGVDAYLVKVPGNFGANEIREHGVVIHALLGVELDLEASGSEVGFGCKKRENILDIHKSQNILGSGPGTREQQLSSARECG